ncbi:MAG: galactose mutarotase [Roseburia sp.]|nr:galactose mutarotase [Roseburia sp.]MCM1099653.1 galactose mutarotase [Ruminococcus flavefaciens]
MAVRTEAEIWAQLPDKGEILRYTLSNDNGMKVTLSSLGAAIVKVVVPDREGWGTDVVLGFERAEDYLNNPSFLGVVIGPSANRIGGARYRIDGVDYQADVNDGVNNLHSHKQNGYHMQNWAGRPEEDGVTFTLEDTDGNMGFPGNKRVSVTYRLGEDNSLHLLYRGSSDKRTILNLTNHVYFNLNGHNSGGIEGHELWLGASNYTPGDAGSIPTGELAPVAGTPMDFTEAKAVGREIGADFEQLRFGGGYDHNWAIDGWEPDGKLRHFATLKAPESGRVMKAYTTLPGVQFYAGNFIDEQGGKEGAEYGPRMGLCLETQYFPDSVNKPQFPSCIFGEGEEYSSETVYRFENA